MLIKSITFLLLIIAFPMMVNANDIGRSIPPSCQFFIDSEYKLMTDTSDESIETRWNKSYSNGHSAIRKGEYSQAQEDMCNALYQARNFSANDWRFAETLDELGLIHYMLGQDTEAEYMQGAAVAELLLAVGPSQRNKRRTRSISLFIQRLNYVYKRQDRDELAEEIMNKPYKIFALEYLPINQKLLKRLGWLVSEYLGEEDMNAANDLLSFIEISKNKINE